MVSIIIVSHSQKLAEGVVELAAQMTQGKIDIRAAAGIDDPENPIGTDATQIMLALEEVDASSGILVLVDMGSALLSTDMALELVAPELAEQVSVCPAPLVEGGVAAAVAAAAGLPLSSVVAEAKGALAAKYQQLGETLPCASPLEPDQASSSEAPVLSTQWQVQNPHGIHARPASNIVTQLAGFDAELWLEKQGKRANARSINSIALLGIRQQDEVQFFAQGKDAEAALGAFIALAENHFGETLASQASNTPAAGLPISPASPDSPTIEPLQPDLIQATPASEGLAVAPVWHYKIAMPAPRQHPAQSTEQEWSLFTAAMHSALQALQQLQQQATQHAADEAGIFAAHQQIISDPELHQQLQNGLAAGQGNIEQVWAEVIEATAAAYAATDDPYLQAREKDIQDVGLRLMRLLQGKAEHSIKLQSPVILLADDLTPSDTARLDPKLVKGICLQAGGTTSHTAILARALGIPAVVGCHNLLQQCQDGELMILNGHKGTLHTKPSPAEITEASLQVSIAEQQRQQAEQQAQAPAQTQDGKPITVLANIASVQDAEQAAASGAEGVGLLRSEFLYMERSTAPSEQQQVDFYNAVCSYFPESKVVVRTLDIGGDKPLAYLQQQREDNPFLGCRGLRLCLQQPALFMTQLRALLRSHAQHPNLAIMFPMVSSVDELLEAKQLLVQAQQQLHSEGVVCQLPQVGIMIEVPAAVVCADQLAQHADFFSIGSNDLSQYVMAADRGNSSVSHLAQANQPAVLRMIRDSVKAATAAQIPLSICGEMAGDTELAPVLLGLGVETLSMSGARIAKLKQTIRQTNQQAATKQAQQLLAEG